MAAAQQVQQGQQVTVQLGERSYAIHVGQNLLPSLGERMRALGLGERVAIVTNPVVDGLYGERVRAALQKAGFDAVTIQIPDGEEHKNLAWLAFVYEKLVEARLERGSVLLALGGGVVGDLTGFAAATYLRGIDLVQVPTTLVAQIDSAIGGKTGVDLAAGKNLIGAFKHPRLVLADTAVLATLPPRQLRAGLAEVIKAGAILSPEVIGFLEKEHARVLTLDPDAIQHLVYACAQLKALVVSEDETESDYRAILNFGHTVGHAIETLTEYRSFLHGEAVAIGMGFALRLSVERGLLRQQVADRVLALLTLYGLPTDIPDDLSRAALALAVEADKKRSQGRVKFVCLEDLGRTRFERLSTEELQSALERA
ncbi:MAG: 3-dehydroquinate synthase [Thermodesulfobacteriota bacterium]